MRDLPSCLQPKWAPLLVPRSIWGTLAVLFLPPWELRTQVCLGKESEPLDLLRECVE